MKKPLDTNIIFRINIEDKTTLDSICTKFEISYFEFFRNSIFYFNSSNNNEKIFKRDVKFKRELLYEINRYGNNLNQIAYNLNRLFKANITSLQAQAIDKSLLKLSKIEKELRRIKKTVSERL